MGAGVFVLITVPVGEIEGVHAENSILQCCKNLNVMAVICHHRELIKTFVISSKHLPSRRKFFSHLNLSAWKLIAS